VTRMFTQTNWIRHYRVYIYTYNRVYRYLDSFFCVEGLNNKNKSYRSNFFPLLFIFYTLLLPHRHRRSIQPTAHNVMETESISTGGPHIITCAKLFRYNTRSGEKEKKRTGDILRFLYYIVDD
jgi:hypothetical protein